MTRYRWVDFRKAEGFTVTDACAVARVSTSAFYTWHATASRGPTGEQLEEAYLINAIVDVHRDSGGSYGAPRVTAALRRAPSQRGRHRPCRTCSGAGSTPERPTPRGVATSPTCAPARAGCFSAG